MPPSSLREEMHGANADFIRLTDAGRYSCQPRHLTDALASRQPLLGSLDLGGGDWRPTKPNGCCTGCRLSTQNSVTARLAEVERHHFRKVEDRQTVAGCRVETLLVQIQCNTVSSARLDDADEIDERAAEHGRYCTSITLSTVPERIASSNAVWPGLRSRPFFVVGLSMNTLVNSPPTLGRDCPKAGSLLFGG